MRDMDTAKIAGLLVIGALVVMGGITLAFKGSVHF